MKRSRIVYSIDVDDLQDVARREFNRELSKGEVKSVADRLGDYIDWYEAVNITIAETRRKDKKRRVV